MGSFLEVQPRKSGKSVGTSMNRSKGARWRALTLMTCACIALSTPMAGAQEKAAASISIPAQELGTALAQLGRETGREIVFPADLVRGLRTGGVTAQGSVEQAVAALLSGTGLSWRANGAGTIIIEKAPFRAGAADGTVVPAALEEIMVTAQRRAERGQDVPVSVTAFGAAAIDAYRLERLRDLSRVTPGLLVSSFSQSSPTIAIRGASNTFTQIGANKPVAIVVDDIFIPRNSAADFDLFGLNSIQVLRGPQGTLFGRNVTGGAIVLDTGKPAYGRNSAKLRGTIGNYSARAIEADGSVAAGDKAAFRLSGAFREHDGYGFDRLAGTPQDDQDSKSIRAQARFQATEDLEILLGADFGRDVNGSRTLSVLAGLAGDDGNRRSSETGIPQHFERTQKGISGRLYWDVLGGQMVSITGLRKSRTDEYYSNVGLSYRFLTGTQSQLVSDDADSVRAFSQEIRYASPLWEEGNFIVGVYYLDESSRRLLLSKAYAAVSGNLVTNQGANQAVDSRSMAAFIDGTVHLPLNFDLTAGVRYTHDRKRASLTRTDAIVTANAFSFGGVTARWGEFTPRAILAWSPTRDIHAYVSYARGYTAGGFNTEASTPAVLSTPFNPEMVRNYEAGIKTDWLDNRLRLNVSAFRMRYKDKQELFFNNLTRILNINNAAKATSKGAEVEARVTVTEGLTLNGSYGRLDTRYDNFVIPGGVVNTGNPLGSSPHNKVALSANLSVPIGAWGEAFGTAVYSRTSSYFTGATADPNLRVGAYSLVNLSAGIAPADGRWRLTAFVRNLDNTQYLLTPSTQTVRSEYLGEPRTFGVTAQISF